MKDLITASAPKTGYVSIPMPYATKADTDALAERLAALEAKLDRLLLPATESTGAVIDRLLWAIDDAYTKPMDSGLRAFLDTGSWSSVYG